MTAPFTPPIAAPIHLTDYELAELAAEQALADRIEDAREAASEAALWNRNYANGDFSLDDWFAATGRTLAEFMPAPEAYVPAVSAAA